MMGITSDSTTAPLEAAVRPPAQPAAPSPNP